LKKFRRRREKEEDFKDREDRRRGQEIQISFQDLISPPAPLPLSPTEGQEVHGEEAAGKKVRRRRRR